MRGSDCVRIGYSSANGAFEDANSTTSSRLPTIYKLEDELKLGMEILHKTGKTTFITCLLQLLELFDLLCPVIYNTVVRNQQKDDM
ncbi:unnamed protein product [Cylicocyclus nassatus]|uniref:Uncharacterized protein n=1 Tax=Cylicocyclus nassatus TaxID=53992 RepID=A0AA36HFA6_CYLNA|nr:unnamed protein product [Cylicocyclus nassatus]